MECADIFSAQKLRTAQLIPGAFALIYAVIGEEQKPFLDRNDRAATLHIIGEGVFPDQLIAKPLSIGIAHLVQGRIKGAILVQNGYQFVLAVQTVSIDFQTHVLEYGLCNTGRRRQPRICACAVRCLFIFEFAHFQPPHSLL